MTASGSLLCIVPNPSIDKTATVDRLVQGSIHRPTEVIAVPGGKGLNVARAARSLGIPADAVVLLAGHAGRWIDDETFNGLALDIEATVVGEKQWATDPVVENNVIEDGNEGLLSLNGFPATFRNNVFRRNKMAVVLGLIAGDNITHKDSPIFTGNVLEANEDALFAYISGAPRDGTDARTMTLKGNSFVGTTCTDITATQIPDHTSLTVDASQSRWGTPDGPHDRTKKCPAIKGTTLTVSPWLAAAP